MKLTRVGQSEPLYISSSLDVLKSKGLNLARKLGVNSPLWRSNVVIGDKNLANNIREYRLDHDGKLLFKIES